MDQENRNEKMEEVMLPGFRFHPTDEELVGFYLRRKIQHRPLSIELIKQLDIYKYDPWDLPKLATTGEKEWYFYCPRDRKYRNSARPNRVTGAGFWKATGTDRPIYSSENSKCIGLKKSLVFYKGRAAKGIKTDWMMHEFRLPSINDSGPAKRYLDKDIPPNDGWAICRIFKKANSTTQRALSHSWVSPTVPHENDQILLGQHIIIDGTNNNNNNNIFNSDNISHVTTKNSSSVIQFGDSSSNNEVQQSISSFSPLLDPINNFPYKSIITHDHHPILSFPSSIENHDEPPSSKCTTNNIINDASSLLLNMSSSFFGDFGRSNYKDFAEFGPVSSSISSQDQQCNNFLMTLPQDMIMRRSNFDDQEDQTALMSASHQKDDHQWGVPINLPILSMGDQAWKSNLIWDSSSPCPSSDISTTYSTNKCYS